MSQGMVCIASEEMRYIMDDVIIVDVNVPIHMYIVLNGMIYDDRYPNRIHVQNKRWIRDIMKA